jgi:hypothetical protein
MISAVAADPIISSSGLAGYRHRPTTGERSLLPNSPPPAPKNSSASDSDAFPQHEQPAEPRSEAGSMFAAAVIAGALPPVPTTMEELIMRIGSLPIPPESEARLKDLLA